MYERTDASWLTPVELFQPVYAQTLAQCIVTDYEHKLNMKREDAYVYGQKQQDTGTDRALRIVEVGPGNGTCAKNMLDYIQNKVLCVCV